MIIVNLIFIRLYSISISAYWFMSLDWKFYYCLMDIWCVSTNGYIDWFLWDISIVICLTNGYNGWFDLKGVIVGIYLWVEFIEWFHDLLLKNLNNKHIWIGYMNRVQECSIWFGFVDSKTLVLFLFVYLLIFTFFWKKKNPKHGTRLK
jgi:hypothetical protein